MKTTIVTASLALVIGVVLGALFFRAGGDGDQHDHSGEAAAAVGGTWTCSMHPQVQAPKPGKCPICAMDLIPVGAIAAGGGPREFVMSEAAKKLADIHTTEVVRTNPEAEVRLFGKVMYDETRVRTVAARFPGRIDRLFVDYTGVPVKQGDHLAVIYSPDLLSVQSELLTAKRFNNAKGVDIARDKLRLWGFSEKSISEIEASGKTSDQLTIDAPKAGVVIQKDVNEGDYVETGTPYFKIAELDQVWVMLDAYESDTPWLRFGQKVEFETKSLPGRIFEGQISFLAPELDPKTRTVSVRVNVPNESGILKPGMFVSGVVRAKVAGEGKVIDPSLAGKWVSPMHPEIVKDGPGKCDVCGMDLVPAEELGYVAGGGVGETPLVVPASAVLHTGKRSVVYVAKPDAKTPTYEGQEVVLGPRAGEWYIVESGLEEGDRVVSEGAFTIDSALQIQAKTSMMLPPPIKLEVTAEFLAASDQLLGDYFAVQRALAADSLEQAQAAAKSAIEQLLALPGDNLSEAADKAWSEVAVDFSAALQAIMDAQTIESAREHFQKLSGAAVRMVRQFGAASIPVYELHCPMAFDNAGANWLQSEKALSNPYFGAKMLNCGSLQETLVEPKKPQGGGR